jgi:hypothetical protein
MKRQRAQRAALAASVGLSPAVVVIGSYREDLPGLLAFSDSLRQLGLRVLHPPPRVRKRGESSGFVRLDCDQSDDPAQVQRNVLLLIDRADAVVLYNPSGRVGISAAMEIGYALRAHKSILATAPPADTTIRALIRYEPSTLTKFILHQPAAARDSHEQVATR